METWKMEIIKTIGIRGALYPMQLMSFAYPFGIREGGRTAKEMREGKKADYIHTIVKELLEQGYIAEMEDGSLELDAKGWDVYVSSRGMIL